MFSAKSSKKKVPCNFILQKRNEIRKIWNRYHTQGRQNSISEKRAPINEGMFKDVANYRPTRCQAESLIEERCIALLERPKRSFKKYPMAPSQ
ncbi:hypothetical protein Leryth_020536, partial [Lithospermum erythrorhizon]